MSDRDVLKLEWFVVGAPWLPPNTEPYIVAGSPDPQAAKAVCDTFPVEDWGDDPESSEGYENKMAERWAIANHICEVHNAALREASGIDEAYAKTQEWRRQVCTAVHDYREARDDSDEGGALRAYVQLIDLIEEAPDA